jgi:hypothetical protein
MYVFETKTLRLPRLNPALTYLFANLKTKNKKSLHPLKTTTHEK